MRPLPLGLLMAMGGAPAVAGGLDEVSGVVVTSVLARQGPPTWRAGGLGKLSGDGAGFDTQATLVLRDQLTDRVGLLASVDAQLGDESELGVGEVYVVVRPDPSRSTRLSGRLGLFFPPVSLEHDGPAWALSQTLIPSVANSWVAEEVKVAGAEMTTQTHVATVPVAITLALFQGDDTAGSLLAFRGWAAHPYRAHPGHGLRLPPVPDLFSGEQAPVTQPIAEVDGRWGWYGRVEVRPTPGVWLAAFGFDNRGDEVSVRDGQYAWRTRFSQLSLNWSPGSRYAVLAQVLQGRTSMGRPLVGASPAEVAFQTAFVMLTGEVPGGSLAFRGEQFSVSDRTFKSLDNNAEQGHALTLAWTHRRSLQQDWLTQLTWLQSRRTDRLRLRQSPSQIELELRFGLRWTF